jgi:homoserine dehydrogenase
VEERPFRAGVPSPLDARFSAGVRHSYHSPDREPPIRTYNICLLGFGNVNRTLARLLQEKAEELAQRNIAFRITGVASRRLGWIAGPAGVNLTRLEQASPGPTDVRQWLSAAQADVLFEATSLEPQTGQPAIDYIRAALGMGAHAITANKGTVVHAYRELRALASEKGRRFLFESTVMDGVPIFSMFRENLPALELRGFRGILNSATNVILGGMEAGFSFEDSLKRAQQLGVAETDASHDIDGWDAAVKVAALVTVLMNYPITLSDISREGIRDLTGEAVRSARVAGKPYKLVCRAQRGGSGISASVGPEQVPLSDPLAWIEGTSSIVYFETDMFPGLALTEVNPGPEATSYGMLADFVRAVSDQKS